MNIENGKTGNKVNLTAIVVSVKNTQGSGLSVIIDTPVLLFPLASLRVEDDGENNSPETDF